MVWRGRQIICETVHRFVSETRVESTLLYSALLEINLTAIFCSYTVSQQSVTTQNRRISGEILEDSWRIKIRRREKDSSCKWSDSMQHESNKQSNVQQASKQARNKRRGDAPLSDYDDYGASSETGILSSLSTGHSLNTEESPIADPLRVLSGNETPDSTGGLVHGVSHVGMQDEDDEQGEFASSGDDAFQDDEAIEDVDGEVVYLEEPPCPSSEALALTSGVRYADADCSKMVFQGYSGAVKVYTAVDLLSSLATHLKTHGYHDASRAVKELGHQTKDLADWKSLRMVQATDLFDLKFTKMPSKKTKKDAGFKMKKAFERDFRSGLIGLRQNEVQMFLHDYCVNNLMKYEDWVSLKHTVAHLDFKK